MSRDGAEQIPADTPSTTTPPTNATATTSPAPASSAIEGRDGAIEIPDRPYDPAIDRPNQVDNNWLDDLIYRSHPELWRPLFGPVDSPEAAAEQVRQQNAWIETAKPRCPAVSHCKSEWVPAPAIPGESLNDFRVQLNDDGRWLGRNRG